MKLLKNDDEERKRDHLYDDTLEGKIDYARTFKIDDKGVSVETIINGDGKDQIAELYETLPVYLRDPDRQPQATPTVIEFQIGGRWTPATAEYQQVTAVRLARFNGAAIITFDKARHVKLSPANWADTWFTKCNCRNVMVDLLDSGGKPAALKDTRKLTYRIEPAAK
jgi:hypothetical protein